MSGRILFTTACALFLTAAAHAQEGVGNGTGISQFEHHAPAKVFEVTPEVGYLMSDAKDRVTTVKTDDKNQYVQPEVMVEYGLLPQLSLGVDVGYESGTHKTTGTVETSKTISGLRDILLYGRGHIGLGVGNLAYGLGVSVSPQNNKSDANSENAATGGTSVLPYVGYEAAVGPGILGGQVNYAYRGKRTSDNTSVKGVTNENESTGGDTFGLAAFYEWNCCPTATLGAALVYDRTNARSNLSGTLPNENSAYGVNLYAPIRVASNITILPELDWTKVDFSNDASTYTHTDRWFMQVGARFAF